MATSLEKQALAMSWTASEIRQIKKLNDSEAVVIVRHQHANGTMAKMRWWVIRRGETWKVYDMESLELGLRLSTTVASLLETGPANIAALSQAVKTLRETVAAVVVWGDLDRAEKYLNQLKGTKLPPQLDAFRWLLAGLLKLRRGQAKEGLDALDTADRLQPDMPIVELYKGTACNMLGKHDEALKHLQAYRDLLGDSAVVCFELGEVLRES